MAFLVLAWPTVVIPSRKQTRALFSSEHDLVYILIDCTYYRRHAHLRNNCRRTAGSVEHRQ